MWRIVAVAVVLFVATGWYAYSTPPAIENHASSPGVEAPRVTPLRPHGRAIASPEGDDVMLGVVVRKDRACEVQAETVTLPDTGELLEVLRCVPETPVVETKHPYTDYPPATLASMSYGDAVAAEVLGLMKLGEGERDEGVNLLYRAVALNGGAEILPFHNALNHYLIEFEYRNEHGEWVRNIENREQRFVFAYIARRLGDDTLSPVIATRYLREAGVSEQRIGVLERQAEQILLRMAEIEQTVTGGAGIRERADV